MTFLSRVHLSIEVESNSEHFQFLTYHYSGKLGLSKEVEFLSEPSIGLLSSSKSKLETKIEAFGWVELQESQTLIFP